MSKNAPSNLETATVLDAIERLRTDLSSSITSNVNKHMDTKFKNLESNLTTTNYTLNKHEQELKALKRESRKKNLIFHGVPDSESDYHALENTILNILNIQMKLNFSSQDIDFARRLGKRVNGNKPRPILVSFIWFKKVVEILANKKALSNSNIAITEDFPQDVLETRKKLLPIMKGLRENNNHAYIKYDKLYVNGKEWECELTTTDPEKSHNKRIHSDEINPNSATELVTKTAKEQNVNIQKNKRPRGRPSSLERNRKNSLTKIVSASQQISGSNTAPNSRPTSPSLPFSQPQTDQNSLPAPKI